MKIRNVSPMGDLDVPLLGAIVAHGEVVDVADEDAQVLLEQPYHFKLAEKAPAKTPAKKEGETK